MHDTKVVLDALRAHFNVKPLSIEDGVREVFRKCHAELEGRPLYFRQLDTDHHTYKSLGTLPSYVTDYYQRLESTPT